MQHHENYQQENLALITSNEDECRIMESNIRGDPMTSNANIPISYWLILHELFNSYTNNIPSFALLDVLTRADAHETGFNNEVN